MKSTIKKSILNQRLKRMRELRGWSQKYVAERIDAPAVCYVSRWERGVTTPSPFYQEKLCTLFDKNAYELGFLGDTNEDSDETCVNNSVSCEAHIATSPKEPPLHTSNPIPPLVYPFDLVGRTDTLHLLKQRLCTGQGGIVTTLYGLPGVGKTSLAATFAHHDDVKQSFCDGILWVNVGVQPNNFALLFSYGMQLGIPANELEHLINDEEALICAIRVAIGQRHLLLIIDDIWKAEEAQVFLKIGGNNCAYLVTTRFLSVALRLANNGAIAVSELNEEDGLALLAHFIPSIISQEPSALRSLVQSVGGLPFALTLMGKYLQMHAHGSQPRRLQTALEYLSNTEQRLRLSAQQVFLEHSSGPLANTIISLFAIIAKSNEQLEEDARQVFYALAILPVKPHSFSEEAAIAISTATINTLDTLTDAGLLEDCGPGRYTLHKTISDYARSKKTDIQAKTRFISYTVDYIKQYKADYEALELEFHTILAGLEIMFEMQCEDDFLHSICNFIPFLHFNGFYELAEIHLQRIYQLAIKRKNLHDSISILLHISNNRYEQSMFRQAEDYYREGLVLADQLNDHKYRCLLLSGLGAVTYKRGEYIRAEIYLQQALLLARQYDYDEQIIKLFSHLGIIEIERGNYPQAESYLQEGLTLARQYNDRGSIATLLENLGQVFRKRGAYVKAEIHLQEGLRIARELGYRLLLATVLINLGQLEAEQGNYEQAKVYLQEGLTLAYKVNNQEAICKILQISGIIAAKQGTFAQAQMNLQEGLAIAQQIEHRELITLSLLSLGMITIEGGNYTQAEAHLQKGLSYAYHLGHSEWISNSLIILGTAASKQQHYSQAKKYLQEGLSLARHIHNHECICSALYHLGELCLQQQDIEGSSIYFYEMLSSAPARNREQCACAYYGLAQVAAAQHNIQKAHHYGKMCLDLFIVLGHNYASEMRQWFMSIFKGNNLPYDEEQISTSATLYKHPPAKEQSFHLQLIK